MLFFQDSKIQRFVVDNHLRVSAVYDVVVNRVVNCSDLNDTGQTLAQETNRRWTEEDQGWSLQFSFSS